MARERARSAPIKPCRNVCDMLTEYYQDDDDGDEDFEPPADEEEEGEEAGIRRRNIQARELSDLLQDAFQQVSPF